MERIPEIKRLTSNISQITQQSDWVKLIQAVMNHYRNRDTFDAEKMSKIRSQFTLSEDVFNNIYTGLYCLVVQIVRNRTRKPDNALSTILEDLAPLGLPEKYAQIFKSACGKYFEELVHAAHVYRPHLPRLTQFRWRTEIAISTSSLNRLLRPSLLIQITLSDGRNQTLQLSIKQFHNLRLGVAMLLKEMNDIENNQQIQRDIKVLPGVTPIY